MCCVFGCSLFPSKRAPKHTVKPQHIRNRRGTAGYWRFLGVLRFRVCFGVCRPPFERFLAYLLCPLWRPWPSNPYLSQFPCFFRCDLRGIESAILNRESGDSESGGSNHAIPRSRLNIDRLRFRLAILSQSSAILLYCDSLARDSENRAIRDSMPLRLRRFPCLFVRFSPLLQGFQCFSRERDPCFFGEGSLFQERKGLRA